MSQLDEQIKQIMKPKPKGYITKLPCCGVNIELFNTGDQYIVCPECGKKMILVWSMLNKKFQYDK